MLRRLVISICLAVLVLTYGCAKGGKGPEFEETKLEPIFNGKDLTGWVQEGGAKWVVEDGLIVGVQGDNNAAGDLFTAKSYKDFLLTVVYKSGWPCNSGIWFRYQSPKKAYQADILEFANPEAYSGILYCPGKMFLAINPDKSIVDRDGWNTMSILAKGDHIQISINDRKVGDVHDNTTDSGKIGFQVHPGAELGKMKIIVREVLLKEL